MNTKDHIHKEFPLYLVWLGSLETLYWTVKLGLNFSSHCTKSRSPHSDTSCVKSSIKFLFLYEHQRSHTQGIFIVSCLVGELTNLLCWTMKLCLSLSSHNWISTRQSVNDLSNDMRPLQVVFHTQDLEYLSRQVVVAQYRHSVNGGFKISWSQIGSQFCFMPNSTPLHISFYLCLFAWRINTAFVSKVESLFVLAFFVSKVVSLFTLMGFISKVESLFVLVAFVSKVASLFTLVGFISKQGGVTFYPLAKVWYFMRF